MTDHLYTVQVRTPDAWLTVGGTDPDTVYSNLCEAVGETRGAQIWNGFAAEKTIREELPVRSEPEPSRPQRPAGGPPAGPPAGPPSRPSGPPAAQPGGGDVPYCAHDKPRNLRSGTNARGEWSAWMCGAGRDTPRHEQCKPLDGVTLEPWK